MPAKTTFTKNYTIFTYNSTPPHEIYRTFAADFLLLMFSEHFLINNILTNSKIFTAMKKIKLFSLFAAILFAGSVMATPTTIFDASDAGWVAEGVNLTTGATTVGDVTWYGRSSAAISSNTLDFSDGVQWTAYLKFGGNSTFKSGSTLAGVFTYTPAVAGTLKVYTTGGSDSSRKLYVSQSISTTNRDTETAIATADGSNKAASIAIASVNAGEMVYIWSDNNMYVYGITFEETAPITEPWVSFSEESVTLAVTPTLIQQQKK